MRPGQPVLRPNAGDCASIDTLRSDHLLSSFAGELVKVSTRPEHMELANYAHKLGQRISAEPAYAEYHENDIAGIVVDELIEALDDIAGDYGLTFSVHPGDGACFGYWNMEDDQA